MINRLLGQACIDQAFWQALQLDPLATLEAEGIELTPEEKAIFKEFVHLPFSEFCQLLLTKLAPEQWY